MGGHRTREATQAKKILIAGGTEMMQLRLAQLMSGNKYRLLFADSGKDAAAKTIGQGANQVIAGLSLSGTSVLAVIRKIGSSLESMVQSRTPRARLW